VYTQCSKCETVFKLSAEVLRAAGGQVRCGKCGEVFNALARLAEDSTAFSSGESPLDLETRADSILQSEPAPYADQAYQADQADQAKPTQDGELLPPGVEIARLEVLDWHNQDEDQPESGSESVDTAAATDTSMEFTLPPGELDRIFVEPHVRVLQPLTLADPDAQADETAAPYSDDAAQAYPDVAQAYPDDAAPHAEDIALHSEDMAPDMAPHPEGVARHPEEAASRPENLGSHPEDLAPHPEAVTHPGELARRGGLEVPEAVRREMLAGAARLVRPYEALTRSTSDAQVSRRRALALWVSAAVACAMLLGAQVIHQNRERWVVGHGLLSNGVRALYSALGAPLPAPANLSAYQLRQWGVTGDPAASGTLRVRASILNTAAQLQPFPLLRVTLADRFGKRIGSRDFEPAEYMGKPTARLLAPGERVDAILDILDPGKNAEGFEINVCLHSAVHKISCADDAEPQTKP